MDTHKRWYAAQVFGVALAAFVCALLIVLLSLVLLRHFSLGSLSPSASQTQGTMTDEQKLALLASLSSSSSEPSVAEREKLLAHLTSTSSQSVSDVQKLQILESLRGK
jgi:hypothetical protein